MTPTTGVGAKHWFGCISLEGVVDFLAIDGVFAVFLFCQGFIPENLECLGETGVQAEV
jgi:hypothetical protein